MADSAGYQLGRTPLNTFLKTLPPGTAAPDAPPTAAIKTIHRLYQITPSNESLQAAIKLGFTGTRRRRPHAGGLYRQVRSLVPSVQEATLVYQKSQQVSAVTLNLFAAAKQLDTQPALFALSSPPRGNRPRRPSRSSSRAWPASSVRSISASARTAARS